MVGKGPEMLKTSMLTSWWSVWKLPTRVEKEKVPKTDVFDGLKNATRLTKTKGKYDKGRHSYAILGLLDAGEVVAAMPHAYRLVATLKNKVGIQ